MENTTTISFKVGQILTTSNISSEIKKDPAFAKFCNSSLQRHISCDWGDLCEEDKFSNNESLIGEDRLFSVYNLPEDLYVMRNKKIYIITEWDRSVTTILFPSEY
ncbi:TPA: hypothetical protein ACGZ9U_003505 [Elizabethkingia anophelis]